MLRQTWCMVANNNLPTFDVYGSTDDESAVLSPVLPILTGLNGSINNANDNSNT